MATTQILSIIGGIIAALIFIYFLTKSDGSKKINTRPSIVKGFAYFFSQNDEEALKELRALALAGGGSPEIYLAIGFLYRKRGEYSKAVQVHEVLLGNKELSSDYKSYLTAELAKDYLLGGMPVKALAALKDLPDREQNPENLITLAKASFEMQNFENAVTYFEKYRKVTGKNIYGFYAKCMVAAASADAGKAPKYIKNALNELPNCRSARFIKANMLMKKNNRKNAIEEYKAILNEGLPRDEKDVKTIAQAFITAGEETEFIKLLKDLVHETKNPFIHLFLASHFVDMGEKEKAIDTMNGYIQHIGGNPTLVKYLAQITENKTLLNILGNRETFRCRVCRSDFDKYKDDCPVCQSFDSIYPK